MNNDNSLKNDHHRVALDHRQRIERVLLHIDENIAGELTLAALAEVACFSPFHFHRIFAAHVGETLSEHIRRVRLESAARWLLATGERVTAIAFDAGYDTPASFAKAFRRYFGVAPSEYRAARGGSPLSPRRTSATSTERNRTMQPEFRTLPARRAICVTRTGMIDSSFTQAAGEAFAVLFDFMERKGLWSAATECIGICPDETGAVPEEECRYQGGFTLRDDIPDPALEGDVEMVTIEQGRWAVFMHAGSYRTMGETWNAVYRDWLPASGMTLRDRSPYEVYLNDVNKTPEDELLTEIHIPVM